MTALLLEKTMTRFVITSLNAEKFGWESGRKLNVLYWETKCDDLTYKVEVVLELVTRNTVVALVTSRREIREETRYGDLLTVIKSVTLHTDPMTEWSKLCWR